MATRTLNMVPKSRKAKQAAKQAKPTTKRLAKQASKPAGKPTAKQATKPAKAAKPAPKLSKQADGPKRGERHHTFALTYDGPSPTVRGHERKLTPIRFDYAAGSVTKRDETFVRDLFNAYGGAVFNRFDCDAGNVGRAITHGFLAYVSGEVDSPTCKLQLTKQGQSFASNRNGAAKR